MQVPDQSIVTYTGSWTGGYFSSPSDVISAVSGALASSSLVLRSQTFSASLLTQLGSAFGGSNAFNVTLSVQVENGLGFASPDDVASIINNAVYQVTGTLPTSFSVPYVQAPGGSNAATGEPAGSSASSGSSLSSWFSGLTTGGAAAFGLAGIGIIVALVLVFAEKK